MSSNKTTYLSKKLGSIESQQIFLSFSFLLHKFYWQHVMLLCHYDAEWEIWKSYGIQNSRVIQGHSKDLFVIFKDAKILRKCHTAAPIRNIGVQFKDFKDDFQNSRTFQWSSKILTKIQGPFKDFKDGMKFKDCFKDVATLQKYMYLQKFAKYYPPSRSRTASSSSRMKSTSYMTTSRDVETVRPLPTCCKPRAKPNAENIMRKGSRILDQMIFSAIICIL